MKDFALVKTFNTRIEVDVARGILQANNIKSFVTADDEGGAAPFPMQPSSTGVQLMVNKNDLKYAKEVLKVT